MFAFSYNLRLESPNRDCICWLKKVEKQASFKNTEEKNLIPDSLKLISRKLDKVTYSGAGPGAERREPGVQHADAALIKPSLWKRHVFKMALDCA